MIVYKSLKLMLTDVVLTGNIVTLLMPAFYFMKQLQLTKLVISAVN